MKYLDEYRHGGTAKAIVHAIKREITREGLTKREYRLMEFCGGHTHAIFRFGLTDLLPSNIRFIHGPGCPVCVLPAGRIEAAIQLVEQENIMLCTYADLMRVPAGKGDTLHKAKARGADIRLIYSSDDALAMAKTQPDKQVVFFAIGFETTTPPTAAVILKAQTEGIANFSVFCNHVLTPPAMRHILETDETHIDGILGPSHVSTIIGSDAYSDCCQHFNIPIVIAGFEPLDVLQSVLMLVRQINRGEARIENQYTRAVKAQGNQKAIAMMHKVFELRAVFEWRGLGQLADSALQIRGEFQAFDAEQRFSFPQIASRENKGCICPSILRGVSRPDECALFAKACTPEDPKGACMVSSEGACAAYYSYGRFQTEEQA